MFLRLALFLGCFALSAHNLLGQGTTNLIARFETDLGIIDVQLLPQFAPNTVANFRGYVSRHDYDNSFIHRSVPSFVVQGGGYRYVDNQVEAIPQAPPVANEFHVSNTRGTLGMAKLSGDPDSATNQWFFNESDSNAPNLDTQNGGFTVFGRIIGASGLAVLDAIAALPIYDFGSPFQSLPLRNYSSGAVQDANLVHVISLAVYETGPLQLSRSKVNTIHLQCLATPGATYRLETSTSAAADSFTFAATVIADENGNIFYDDANPGGQKFYRLTLP